MTNIEKYNHIFEEELHLNDGLDEEIMSANERIWDSVTHMQIIAAIEDEFDVFFETEDILEFDSYNKGKEILEKNQIDLSL